MRVLTVAGEACWWTIHPASKQRSEGEKVRIGDDLILVSVSSERYLVSLVFAGVYVCVCVHLSDHNTEVLVGAHQFYSPDVAKFQIIAILLPHAAALSVTSLQLEA